MILLVRKNSLIAIKNNILCYITCISSNRYLNYEVVVSGGNKLRLHNLTQQQYQHNCYCSYRY